MNYALIGGAGYVAPKHMKAIKDVGGNLIAVLDPHDSVGILDSYFPDCNYFKEFERFDRFCSMHQIDYVSICSPNKYHFEQCIYAMDIGADVICEKPLCLQKGHIQQLLIKEQQTGKKVWNISQLRLGDTVKYLKSSDLDVTKIQLYYTTPRGSWYNSSWKGKVDVAGGLTTAIGIHLFDILLYLFGSDYRIIDWYNSETFCYGNLQINNINVYIELSIELHKKAQRLLVMDKQEFELSNGFTDLHTLSYQNILNGNGVTIEDVSPAIVLCEKLRKH